MTDDRDRADAGRRLRARLLIAVGTLAIVGGAVVIGITKITADQTFYAGSSTTAVLAVGVNSPYLFPAPGPNCTGAWIGLATVIVGIVMLTIGLIATYRQRRAA